MLVTLTYLFFINFHRKKTKSSGGVGYQYKGIYIRRQPFLEKANFACLKCFKYRRPQGVVYQSNHSYLNYWKIKIMLVKNIFVMNLLSKFHLICVMLEDKDVISLLTAYKLLNDFGAANK